MPIFADKRGILLRQSAITCFDNQKMKVIHFPSFISKISHLSRFSGVYRIKTVSGKFSVNCPRAGLIHENQVHHLLKKNMMEIIIPFFLLFYIDQYGLRTNTRT